MPVTQNLDWWLTSISDNPLFPPFWNESGQFWLVVSKGGMVSKIHIQEGGKITKVECYAPTLYNMMAAKYGTEVAEKVANVTYHCTVKPENSLTSIAACCEFDAAAGEVKNISWLDRQHWNDHINLGQLHGVVWEIACGDQYDIQTPLRIRALNQVGNPNYTISVWPQVNYGESKLPAETGQNFGIAHYISVVHDDTVDRAIYDIETNTVYVNPSLEVCTCRVELWPTDHANKTETDNSPIIQLR
jgi:hypothetical protein